MSKIEEYNKAKKLSDQVASACSRALGTDTKDNDKHRVMATFTGISDSSFSPMLFSIKADYGYYGSSSGYSATSRELGSLLADAITIHAGLLLNTAVGLAKELAETKRQQAVEEAKSVIQIANAEGR